LTWMLPTDFWRGFCALVLSFVVAQLAAQVDLAMLARVGQGLPGLYVLTTRMALFEFVVAMALGTTLSVAVAQAARQEQAPRVTRQALVLTAIVGGLLGLLAVLTYPWLLSWMLEDDPELAEVGCSALFWFILAVPFRLLNGVTAFILHARGEGALVVRWKLLELGARIGLLWVLLEGFQTGLWGCFLTGLLLNLGSTVWAVWWLTRRDAGVPWLPSLAWMVEVLRSTSWEGQRVLAMQLFGFTAVALFAAWGSDTDRVRLDAFSAGMTLMLLAFAPLNALLRFLSMRFARLCAHELHACIPILVGKCLPFALGAAVLLALGAQWLGRLYGQQSEWWIVYLWLLAASLPLRVIGNCLRAARQSQGDFSLIARIDSLGLWLIGLPTLILGLYLALPWLAYLYLLLPELLLVSLLLRRYVAGR